MKNLKTALTIAGSDPSGGAGLQVDLKTFHSLGVYGLSVPAVLTAQNTGGVERIHELPADFVSDQLDVLLRDITPAALKTGMLYSTDMISVVADKVRQYSLPNLVIDPVSVSSSGVQLIESTGLNAIRDKLFPLAAVITPNIYEAAVFTHREIENERDMREAARVLRSFGPRAVIITGGHLEGKAMDLLLEGEEFLTFENERLEGEYHGTGCVFSASVAACLSLGLTVREACVRAKDFTFRAMKSAISVGAGMKLLNL